MRRLKIFFMAMLVLSSALIFSLTAISQDTTVSTSTASTSFENTPEWYKIGDYLKQTWLAAKKSGDMSEKYRCFARVDAPFDDGDANFMTSKGFIIQMSSGTIANGFVKLQDLQGVAKLPFVRSIDLERMK